MSPGKAVLLVGSPVVAFLTVGALLIGVVFMSTAEADADDLALAGSDCFTAAPEGTVAQLDEVQTRNAATIANVALELGVPPRGIAVALATALQESRLYNLASRANPGSLDFPHDDVAAGDHDSVGLFQQRDAWGPMSVRMDPAESARMFFTGGKAGQRGLLDIDGWEDMEVWRAAQTVQVSAFPTAYAKHEPTAQAAVSTLLASGDPARGPPAGCSAPVAVDAGSCPPTGHPAEDLLKPDARNVWRCVTAHFPTEYGMGGYGPRPNNPGSDHATGRAVDVMTNPHGDMPTAEQEAYGFQLAEWLLEHHAEFGVTYVIYAGKIRNPSDSAWRPYTHPRGLTDPTHLHYDHVHVSVSGASGTLIGATA